MTLDALIYSISLMSDTERDNIVQMQQTQKDLSLIYVGTPSSLTPMVDAIQKSLSRFPPEKVSGTEPLDATPNNG